MKPLGLAIFLVLVLGNDLIVKAFRCYSCSGNKTSDCYKGKISSMEILTCHALLTSSNTYVVGALLDFNELRDICIGIEQTNTIEETYVRGCALVPKNVSPCEFLEKNYPVTNCKYCSTDLCENLE